MTTKFWNAAGTKAFNVGPTVPASLVDSYHSMLMDDDQFNEAAMRVALQVAEDHVGKLRQQDPGGYDEQDVYDLAAELTVRLTEHRVLYRAVWVHRRSYRPVLSMYTCTSDSTETVTH